MQTSSPRSERFRNFDGSEIPEKLLPQTKLFTEPSSFDLMAPADYHDDSRMLSKRQSSGINPPSVGANSTYGGSVQSSRKNSPKRFENPEVDDLVSGAHEAVQMTPRTMHRELHEAVRVLESADLLNESETDAAHFSGQVRNR